jgi:hypothetical protein
MAEAKPISFDKFWSWLQRHPNCIVRVGSPDAVIYDHEDYHWAFGLENDGTVFVQMIRGKRSVAEVFIDPREITFVVVQPGENDSEFLFNLHDSSEKTLYYFALVHDWDEANEPAKPHWN